MMLAYATIRFLCFRHFPRVAASVLTFFNRTLIVRDYQNPHLCFLEIHMAVPVLQPYTNYYVCAIIQTRRHARPPSVDQVQLRRKLRRGRDPPWRARH